MKTKSLISFTVSAKLICVFVFAYAKCWFSHAKALFTVSHVCFRFKKGKMYEFEPGKFDTKSVTSFVDYWYMNVQAKPVPMEASTL